MAARGANLTGRMNVIVPLHLRKSLKIGRARLLGGLGSNRYARPGLFDLDRKLEPYLQREPGVFLEIGANDGYSQSNTYYLERVKGWRGVLIEPIPALYETCRELRSRSRCHNVACVGSGGPDTIELVDLDLMSVALGQQDPAEERLRLRGRRRATMTVPTSTLSAVIDDSGESLINFMSIDVEGAESQVLAGLDLDRHTPDWLLVETSDPKAVAALLASSMVQVEQLTFHDYLFARAAGR
jgi:FkbM family methyltransferase